MYNDPNNQYNIAINDKQEEEPKIAIYEIWYKNEKVGFFFDKEIAHRVNVYLNYPTSLYDSKDIEHKLEIFKFST